MCNSTGSLHRSRSSSRPGIFSWLPKIAFTSSTYLAADKVLIQQKKKDPELREENMSFRFCFCFRTGSFVVFIFFSRRLFIPPKMLLCCFKSTLGKEIFSFKWTLHQPNQLCSYAQFCQHYRCCRFHFGHRGLETPQTSKFVPKNSAHPSCPFTAPSCPQSAATFIGRLSKTT